MSDLNDVTTGDWLAIVSTGKASDLQLRQVTAVTTGLVKTLNYTFWRDGRAFGNHYKGLKARPASADEIEKWLSRQGKQQTKTQSNVDEPPEVTLARYLTGVSVEDWARLGVSQLKKIKAALDALKR